MKPKAVPPFLKRFGRNARNVFSKDTMKRLRQSNTPEVMVRAALANYALRKGLLPGTMEMYLQETTRYVRTRINAYRRLKKKHKNDAL